MCSLHTLNLPMHPHSGSPASAGHSGAELELEYPDSAPTIPGVPAEFLRPSRPRPRLYNSLDLSGEVAQSAETPLATLGKRPVDACATAADDEPVRARTAAKLALSLRRHLDMRAVRDTFGSAGPISRALHLPGRHVTELIEWQPPASAEKGEAEGSLARRLFGRNKKPRRPPIPEGWLFGPPPE